MNYQTTNLIMALSFGLLEILLPLYLIFRIRKFKGEPKSRVASTILGGLFPSLVIYYLAIGQSIVSRESTLETGVIMAFMAGAFQVISLPISLLLSTVTRAIKNYQAFLVGAVIPSLLWFLLFYASLASGI